MTWSHPEEAKQPKKNLQINMPKSQQDPAWLKVDQDPAKECNVICKMCKTSISLGKDKKNMSISAVKRHFWALHSN